MRKRGTCGKRGNRDPLLEHTHTTPPHPHFTCTHAAVGGARVRWVRLSQTLPSLHLTYPFLPFLTLPLANTGIARCTEQLRGQQFGWGRGAHRCHLSGRLLCTARLGMNGVSLVFKTQLQIQRSVRSTKVSSGRSGFPLLPVTCCCISCSFLSSSPSHLRVSTARCIYFQSYQLTVNIARDKHTYTLLYSTLCVLH